MLRLLAPALALTLLAQPLAAQEHEHATCEAGTVALPADLAGWNDRQPMNAGTRENRLETAALVLGQAYDTTLSRTPDVRYIVRPEKPGGSVSYGGIFALDVTEAGTYRVALGSAAWIDVVRGETVIQSGKFGHGPDCTGVRKMVEFALEPGRYVIQIAANGQADLPLLVSRLN
ncbi:MAG TPA: homogentisate 1,2-dioxygenase [Croceibacterium sp.]|nr:homogentisate 1,2-dioxygenase [Croceibacterium sp.]